MFSFWQSYIKTLCVACHLIFALQWCHNGRNSVSNHQPRDCLLSRLIRRNSKKTSKLRVTGLCAGNSPVTGGFLVQMASNAEYVSIWWRIMWLFNPQSFANTEDIPPAARDKKGVVPVFNDEDVERVRRYWTWTRNHARYFLRGVIIHPCPNFKGLTKPPLRLCMH